jgi:hypothetical protein
MFRRIYTSYSEGSRKKGIREGGKYTQCLIAKKSTVSGVRSKSESITLQSCIGYVTLVVLLLTISTFDFKIGIEIYSFQIWIIEQRIDHLAFCIINKSKNPQFVNMDVICLALKHMSALIS